MDGPLVYCVVVTYHAEPAALQRVLESIRHQASGVIVVDNTEATEPPCAVGAAECIRLGKNMGVATAQNRGISLALDRGADYVWLSDQDTIYPPDFVRKMLACARICGERKIRLAALAPAFFDTHAARVRPFIRHAPFIQAFSPVPGPNVVSDAIASGTLIPSEALRRVGSMRDDFFIDWVDIEWCWRARNLHGLQVIAVGDVVIQHALGDAVVPFWGRNITIRSPIRHYYIIRNAMYLALHSPAPTFPIRIQTAYRAVLWTFWYPIVAPTRKLENVQACWRGLWHGVIGRLGRLG
jgi:rhamnosyltransferase